jgi:uncharacterized protein YegL
MMPLLAMTDSLPRKSSVIFLIVENSPQFTQSQINTLNESIAELTEALAGQSSANAVSEIKIAFLEYGPGAVRWLTPAGPQTVERFKAPSLQPWVTDGQSSFSGMCDELCAKLSKNVFMNQAAGCYPPLIVLFSHGENQDTADCSIKILKKNNWFKHAAVSAVAIGKRANRRLLAEWTGDADNVLDANTPSALRQIVASINMPRLSEQMPHIEPAAKTVSLPDTCIKKELLDQLNFSLSEIAIDYKKKLSKKCMSLSPEKIDEYLNGNNYHVTRKYDGELAVLFFNGETAYCCNSGGNEFPPLPCVEMAAVCLKQAGVTSAFLGAELYADESLGRSHVFDVLSALADTKRHDTLRLAFFDILRLEGKDWDSSQHSGDYGYTQKTLSKIFCNNTLCEPVKYRTAGNKFEVKAIYDDWVQNGGSEGLVIYGQTQTVVKIKPRLNVDVAIIGFSEGEMPETVRTLLFALVTDDMSPLNPSSFQILGRTGNGLSDAQRKELWKQLMPLKVPSNFVEVDSNHAAFHFVQPGLVAELCATDVLVENSRGIIRNPVLTWTSNEWRQSGTTSGYSLISAVISRFRPDKQADRTGARISQLSGYVHNPYADNYQITEVKPPSKILKREVFQKLTSKVMVMKFMVWKTNKESTQYPAYVFSHTNFSSGRSEPLSLDVRVSSSEEQIMQIYRDFMVKNITTGWVKENVLV